MGILISFVFLLQLFSVWIFKNIINSVSYIFEMSFIPFILIVIFVFIFSNKSYE